MLAPQSPWLTILLGALTAMTALGIDMILPALPALAGAFAVGTDRIQLTLSLFILGYAGGQLIYGPLSDRFGRRPMLLIGTAVYMASGLACAASPSIEVLVVARFVQGLGGCAGPVLARAVIRDHHSGRRASQMLSYITLVFALAPLVAPLIGAALLERFGWPAIFWCLSGFGLLLWLGVVVGF